MGFDTFLFFHMKAQSSLEIFAEIFILRSLLGIQDFLFEYRKVKIFDFFLSLDLIKIFGFFFNN